LDDIKEKIDILEIERGSFRSRYGELALEDALHFSEERQCNE